MPADRASEIARALHASPIRGSTHARILRGIAQQVGGGVRRELAERLDISIATVTRSISLMSKPDLGLVQEGRHQPTGPGRPVAPLTLSRDLAMIGIAVTPERGKPGTLLGTVRYLDGSPVGGFETLVARRLGEVARTTTENFLEELATFAEELREKSQIPSGRVLGCGITIAGYVDTRGDIRKAYGGAWSSVEEPVSIRGPLEERLGLPVVVGNDVTSLVARKNLRASQPSDNYSLLVAIDYGIGGAVVVDNTTWLGAHGMAGEPGHLPATGVDQVTHLPGEDPDRAEAIHLRVPACQCETDAADLTDHPDPPGGSGDAAPAGHVEAFASPHAIERRAVENRLVDGHRPIAELAARPLADREICLLFYQGGLALGRTVVAAMNWFDPAQVLIYLPSDALHVPNRYLAGSYYLLGLQREITQNSFAENVDEVVDVRGIALDEIHEKLASGAGYLVLRRLIRLISGQAALPADGQS